jgi:hypothetical protein
MCLIFLSRVLDLARSWCTASFVNIVGSYGVSSLSIFLWRIESFPLRFRYCRIEYFGFENTWCMSCMWIPVVTMGYSIESLDVCFGDQLTDSRDLGVI